MTALKKAAKWFGKGAERHRRITFTMTVPLADLISGGIEGLNERADFEALCGKLAGVGLSDLTYTVVGDSWSRARKTFGCLKGDVTLKVNASVEDIIRDKEIEA